MEQYELPRGEECNNLRLCLDNMQPYHLFIRMVGSAGGDPLVREKLEGKLFDVQETESGLSIILNNSEIFLFNIPDDWSKRASIAYERDPEVHLPTGYNPDDPTLPPVQYSVFRKANMDHYMEVCFHGKAPLRFHSADGPWRFWFVDGNAFK
jgi:hypothetical protein